MPLAVFRGPYSALIQLRYPGNSSDVSLGLEHRVDNGQGCEELVSDDEGVPLSPAEAAFVRGGQTLWGLQQCWGRDQPFQGALSWPPR